MICDDIIQPHVINNGINIDLCRPMQNKNKKKITFNYYKLEFVK